MDITTAALKKAMNEKVCLIKFTAEWCGPCKRIHDSLVNECNSRGVEYIEVNIDDYQEIAQDFQVTSIPMMLISSKGKTLKVTGANMKMVTDSFDDLGLSADKNSNIEAILIPSATLHP